MKSINTAQLLAENQQNDKSMLAWIENQRGGRTYLGNILLRIQGCTPKERASFARKGGFKKTTAEQIKCLDSVFASFASKEGKHAPPMIEITSAVGAVIRQIKLTASQDTLAPQPLKKQFKFSKNYQKKVWGDLVAKQFWPGSKNEMLRLAFCSTVARLSLNKTLLDALTDRDQPRRIARALVNHITGKTREFDKAPDNVRKLVKVLCNGDDVLMGSVRHLAVVKLNTAERRDKPAGRLKQALEAQLRILEMPSNRKIVKEAFASASPTFLQSLERGHKKTMVSRFRGKANTNLRYARS